MIEFEKLPFLAKNTWITSDLHAYHKNITKGVSTWGDISKCRDFDDEILMTQHIINNINKYVKKEDLLINCGDLTFGAKANIGKILKMINCENIIHIQGNHCHHTDMFEVLNFEGVLYDYCQIGYYNVQNNNLFCSHYPVLSWHGQDRGVIQLFGHVHAALQQSTHPISNYFNKLKTLDVGIDNAQYLLKEYRPFNLEKDIIPMMKNRDNFPLDYH